MRQLTPALAALAIELGIRHMPQCRQLNIEYQNRQQISWLRRYVCNCGLVERLQDELHRIIRRDIQNGVKRNLERDD